MGQNSFLKSLNLAVNDISTVEPGLFARAVTRLEMVDLAKADITNEQAEELFTAMCHNSCLKSLNLDEKDLSSVEPIVLATAVVMLENVELDVTNLNTEQLSCILANVQEGINLKRLSLVKNEYDIGE